MAIILALPFIGVMCGSDTLELAQTQQQIAKNRVKDPLALEVNHF